MAINPVLNRELVEHLRSPRAFLLQFVFVAALAGVVLVAWPPEVQIIRKVQISRDIYDTFARGQLLLLALLAPVLAAPAVAAERERRSLDLLLSTPMTGRSIVLGKLLSAVVFLLLLAVSSLPIFACCMFLGAAGPREVAATFSLLFATATASGAVGLAASIYLERVRSALAVSYLVVLPAVLLLAMADPMRSLAPAMVVSVCMLLLALVLVALMSRRLTLASDAATRGAGRELAVEQVGLVLDRRRFPDSLLSPPSPGIPMDEERNPVFQRELHYELFSRGTLLVRLLLQVSLVVALPFYIVASISGKLWIYGCYVMFFAMFIAPALSAGVFSQERERKTFDLLLSTSLDRGRIIAGKLGVNLRGMCLLLALLLPFFLLFPLQALLAPARERPHLILDTLGVIGASVLLLLLATVMIVLLTSFISMLCRSTLRSMVLTYLTLICLFAAPVVAYVVLTRVARMPAFPACWLGVTSPFFSLAIIAPRPPLAVPTGMVATLVGTQLALLSVSCVWLYAAMRRMFDHYCRFGHERGG